MKQAIYRLIFISDNCSPHAYTINKIIIGLIILNILAVTLETVDSLESRFRGIFWFIEVVSISIFALEYVLRMWVCVCNPKYGTAVTGRLRYAVSFYAVVDLIAIVPAFLAMSTSIDLRHVRILRLFRLFRVLKIARYSNASQIILAVLRKSKDELTVAIMSMLVILFVASSAMYIAERTAQPDVFSSIPATLWWGVATLTTVGYGDMFPVTVLGKIIAAFMAMVAIAMFALPAGILSSAFMTEVRLRRQTQNDS